MNHDPNVVLKMLMATAILVFVLALVARYAPYLWVLSIPFMIWVITQ